MLNLISKSGYIILRPKYAILACSLFIASFVLAPTSTASTVYTWIDNNGRTHYSDRPNPNAKIVSVKASKKTKTTEPEVTEQTQAPTTVNQVDRRTLNDQQLSTLCKRAQQNLALLTSKKSVLTNDNKELTAAEREQKLKQTHKDIAFFCAQKEK